MPKIRDLGISVIPVTMRPAEIGGGAADVAYHAGRDCHPTDEDCVPTEHPCGPSYERCAATRVTCNPTDPDCEPTDPPCAPTDHPHCMGTPDCCPTDDQSICSGRSADSVAIPHDAVIQLKQQLQHQIGAQLLN